MRDHILIATTLLALLIHSTPATTQDFHDFDPVRQYIQQIMEARDLPSVSVAVSKDSDVLWEEAFGWANLERRIPASPHTMYSLASISKPITATGLAVLIERGIVGLDLPVDEYLGIGRLRGFAGDAAHATVRRVLAHTAGLPLHYQFFYETEGYAPPTMDETIARYGIVTSVPGEEFQYSNIGFGILDYVIERASGSSYTDFMRRELFVPLGLTRTSVDIGPGLEPFAATRYDANRIPVPFYTFDHPGASAVFSSAHDLVRFGMFHLGTWPNPERGERVLRGATRLKMQQIATPPGVRPAYGQGWFIDDEYGFHKVWHTGSMPGVSTMLALYPEEEVAIVVLLNAMDREQRVDIAREIAAVVIDGYAEAREQAAPADETESAGDQVREFNGRWTGTLRTWQGELPMSLEIQSDGDVHVELGTQLTTVLNEIVFSAGRLAGRFTGHIPTSDAMRHPQHEVQLNVRVNGGRMVGQVSAITTTEPTHFVLTSFVALNREEGG